MPRGTEALLLRGRKESGAPRAQCPAAGWPGTPSPTTERKQLERFLHLHGLSLQDTTRARTGMKYSQYSLVQPLTGEPKVQQWMSLALF
ncbi:voltage-gated potassium channel subunit beta-1-like protein [Willisornis vidua]|uniref:Voltage-gated potassium channel subunit beta-1-like protein n=1 Tax=Willisornis vidua TaxID=1566151 RepID=A0ABQ9DF13_9PASS|nr:voltage-gated potassium channel subunit beta-1-like protein [Willisornis vidua]